MVDAATTYAVGKNVYNGGSPAATGGMVDPIGYINRAADSGTFLTPGIAQAAINRLKSQSIADTINNPTLDTKTQAAPTSTNNAATQSLQNQQQQQAAPPTVNIVPLTTDELGQVQVSAQNSLPLDSDLAAQQNAYIGQINNQIAQLVNQENQLSQNYTTSARQMYQQEPDVLNKILAAFSGRGLGFSSGYGNALTNENASFAQKLSDLLNTSQQGVNTLRNQVSAAPTTLDQLVAQIMATQAQRNQSAILQNQVLGLGAAPSQYVVVNNPVDRQQAILAGFDPSQIIDTSNGGQVPTNLNNGQYIFAGKAGGSSTPLGGTNAQGADRNATEKLLASLLKG